MNCNKYQLIEPFLSNKIYETSSAKRASKRCFEEIKKLKMEGLKTFKMKNLNSGEIFTFRINCNNPSNLKINGNEDDVLNLSYLINLNNSNNLNANLGNNSTKSNQCTQLSKFDNSQNGMHEVNKVDKIDKVIEIMEDMKDIAKRIDKNLQIINHNNKYNKNDESCVIS